MFQLQCLSLIISHNLHDKDSMEYIAFLLDRVLINMEQKQIFGTQLNGKFTIPETTSPTEIDSLRKKFGLEPIKDYIKRVRNFTEKQEA